tara:strand:- start:98 stop:331 length:234 start_codon:yes stop_codon:yes gene_type:complete
LHIGLECIWQQAAFPIKNIIRVNEREKSCNIVWEPGGDFPVYAGGGLCERGRKKERKYNQKKIADERRGTSKAEIYA